MRSGWVQLGAWAAATGAAVALSWLGVHAVLADTVFEGPVALPLPSTATSPPGPAASLPPAPGTTDTPPAGTGSPGATGTPGGAGTSGSSPGSTTPRPGPDPTAGPPRSPSPTRSPSSPSHGGSASMLSSPSSTTGTVRSYLMPGGRVAIELREHDAELVSATPEPGWTMQVWRGDQWMRINFSRDDRVSSVYVTWNGFEPTVQVVPG
ncbi:hypothetical protein [Kitasatospora sp. NPDC004531]